MRENTNQTDELWRLRDVLDVVHVGKSTFWKWVADGYAPKPVHLGKRCTCWRASEIRKFISEADTAKV